MKNIIINIANLYKFQKNNNQNISFPAIDIFVEVLAELTMDGEYGSYGKDLINLTNELPHKIEEAMQTSSTWSDQMKKSFLDIVIPKLQQLQVDDVTDKTTIEELPDILQQHIKKCLIATTKKQAELAGKEANELYQTIPSIVADAGLQQTLAGTFDDTKKLCLSAKTCEYSAEAILSFPPQDGGEITDVITTKVLDLSKEVAVTLTAVQDTIGKHLQSIAAAIEKEQKAKSAATGSDDEKIIKKARSAQTILNLEKIKQDLQTKQTELSNIPRMDPVTLGMQGTTESLKDILKEQKKISQKLFAAAKLIHESAIKEKIYTSDLPDAVVELGSKSFGLANLFQLDTNEPNTANIGIFVDKFNVDLDSNDTLDKQQIPTVDKLRDAVTDAVVSKFVETIGLDIEASAQQANQEFKNNLTEALNSVGEKLLSDLKQEEENDRVKISSEEDQQVHDLFADISKDIAKKSLLEQEELGRSKLNQSMNKCFAEMLDNEFHNKQEAIRKDATSKIQEYLRQLAACTKPEEIDGLAGLKTPIQGLLKAATPETIKAIFQAVANNPNISIFDRLKETVQNIDNHEVALGCLGDIAELFKNKLTIAEQKANEVLQAITHANELKDAAEHAIQSSRVDQMAELANDLPHTMTNIFDIVDSLPKGAQSFF